MTPREIVLEQVRHRETVPVPWTLSLDEDVEARLTRHYGSESWRERIIPYIRPCCSVDRRRKKECGENRARDAWGNTWRTDGRPHHVERPCLPDPSLGGYRFPAATEFLDPEMKTRARRELAKNPGSFSTINFGCGIWEAAWSMRGMENALADCLAEPAFFEELIDRLAGILLAQVEFFRDIPADAFFFSDDWGYQRGVMIGPERWRRFFKPRYARIYEEARAQGKIVISHCCGSVAEIMPDLVEIGLDVLESVQPEARGMNPYELKKEWGDKIAFWGCLGSQGTIPRGTPAEIRAEVSKLRRVMGAGGGFILAPAKSLQPETPTGNAVAVFEAFTDGA